MSLGNWDPSAAVSADDFQVSSELLQRFIHYSREQQLDQLTTLLSAQEQQVQAHLMRLERAQWIDIATTYSDDDIEQLMRFFTCAEQLPGWEAGAKSPVISLGKVLKTRGTGINRELALWIRNHSSNQFLPHGPLL